MIVVGGDDVWTLTVNTSSVCPQTVSKGVLCDLDRKVYLTRKLLTQNHCL